MKNNCILQIYTAKTVHPQHSKEHHSIQSFPLQNLVLLDLFILRICLTIERVNKPFGSLWIDLPPPPFFFAQISPNVYNIGLISIKKPQNVTLKGFWGLDLLVLLLRDFFCCLYVQQNTCFSFYVMVRKKMYCTLFLFIKFVSGVGSFSFSERILVSIIDWTYF